MLRCQTSMTNRVPSWLGGLLVVALGSACGGSSTASTEAVTPSDATGGEVAAPVVPPTVDPRSVIPADAHGLVRVHVPLLLASPHWPTLERWVREARPFGDGTDALLGLVSQTEMAYGSVVVQGQHQDLGHIFVRGDYENTDVPATLRAVVPPEVGPRLQPTQVGGFEGIGDRNGALLEVDPRSWWLGSTVLADTTLAHAGTTAAAAPAQRPALMSDPRFQELAARIGFDDASGMLRAVAVAPTPKEVLTDFLPDGLENVEALALAVDLDADLRVQVQLDTGDAGTATRVVQVAQAQLQRALTHPLVRLMGLDSLIAALSLRADGPTVHVDFVLPSDDVVDVLRRVEPMAMAQLQELATETGHAGATSRP